MKNEKIVSALRTAFILSFANTTAPAAGGIDVDDLDDPKEKQPATFADLYAVGVRPYGAAGTSAFSKKSVEDCEKLMNEISPRLANKNGRRKVYLQALSLSVSNFDSLPKDKRSLLNPVATIEESIENALLLKKAGGMDIKVKGVMNKVKGGKLPNHVQFSGLLDGLVMGDELFVFDRIAEIEDSKEPGKINKYFWLEIIRD